ncbi:MAG: hypothetical protein AB7F40_08205 [Victivallaceae bacterium]|nr:hypothetical protein [Victivallaceae bacterium]
MRKFAVMSACAALWLLAAGCESMDKFLNPPEPTAEQKAEAKKKAEAAKPDPALTGGYNDTERKYIDAIHKQNEIDSKSSRKGVFGY